MEGLLQSIAQGGAIVRFLNKFSAFEEGSAIDRQLHSDRSPIIETEWHFPL
jgi:hypothetical protein